MREFRGKKNKGEWVFGSLIIAKNYCCILQDEEKVHPMDYPYLDGGIGTIDGQATPVIPETVGQYTGLTDYNGRKIFEADIVKIQIGNLIKYGVVFYSETAARTGIKDSTGEANFSFMQQPLIKQYQIIVIGNIFDNPELLKEGETK